MSLTAKQRALEARILEITFVAFASGGLVNKLHH